MKKRLKVCLAASAGGHLSQMLKLAEHFNSYEQFFITTSIVVTPALRDKGRVYVVPECNRTNPIKLAKVLFSTLGIMLRERPDVIISTGAAAGCLACFIGKAAGARVVWIDSITNVEKPSLSGRLVGKIADLFLVQWPEIAQKYPNTEYVGTVV